MLMDSQFLPIDGEDDEEEGEGEGDFAVDDD
jgi:hypothetical protein